MADSASLPPLLIGLLDALDTKGVALFDLKGTLLYANPAMRAITGQGNSVGSPLSELSLRHTLRTENGEPLSPDRFPIANTIRSGEPERGLFEYVSEEGEHRWLDIGCGLAGDGVAYAIAEDVTRRRAGEDRLQFLRLATKTLSLSADFHARLRQKAMLAVPRLADWCAIDILTREGAIEHVAFVHRDPVRLAGGRETERRFPSQADPLVAPRSVIASGKAMFVPSVTDEVLAAAARSPEEKDALAGLRLSSVMALPIRSGGKTLGCMTLAYAESGRAYTEEDFDFFSEFCDHLGVLLENARLYDAITERDKAKDLFLAALSHELRNPLAPIKTSLELMRLRGVPADIAADVATIEHQFDHMNRLLDDLLETTRYTSAKIELAKSAVDAGALLERVMRAARPLARASGIQMEYEKPSEPVSLHADPTRLEQAVMNLILNAVKFTEAGGAIRVSLSREDEEAVIAIRDTGIGIDPAHVRSIFDIYYQGDPTNGRGRAGLGLGLYLVRKIVELHGGSIAAVSEGEGKGSEFTIRLPLASENAQEGERRAVHSEEPAGRRALVVDDNVAAADALVRLLGALGGRAEAAYDGPSALARNDLDRFDFILLDIGMPGMSGYEVVREMRVRGLRQPVIALSGYGQAEDKARALSEGFTDHLTKPAGVAQLRELFARLWS